VQKGRDLRELLLVSLGRTASDGGLVRHRYEKDMRSRRRGAVLTVLISKHDLKVQPGLKGIRKSQYWANREDHRRGGKKRGIKSSDT